MNLHPASGIQSHEEKYPEMAEAMGIDPKTKEYVPFDIEIMEFEIQWNGKCLKKGVELIASIQGRITFLF